MLNAINNGERFELTTPTKMPNACGFLWNKNMMIQMNCRGYAVAQFMQPEPAKYTHAPNLEAKTFMQPEQPYYAHHPGRFFYIKDEDTGQVFSAPFAPVKAELDKFSFSAGKYDIQWHVEHLDIAVDITLQLPTEDIVELWQCKVTNLGSTPRNISVYAYFPSGYMSWMNQSAQYEPTLGALVSKCITPYQKYTDYFKNQHFKDLTYVLHSHKPTAFETCQYAFEGEGGLHRPAALEANELSNSDALYETPTAVLQYRIKLSANQSETYRFALGPAKTHEEITNIRAQYIDAQAGFESALEAYKGYIDAGAGVLNIKTPDEHLNQFVNHWLARQVYYHGDVNRLTTDPQTRNYLQDNMGMTYIKPETTRNAFIHALSQQESSGAMPDGIILVEGTELKYINQIPHTDHCVWLPVCLQAYLDETNDYALLEEPVEGPDGQTLSVFDRISAAMRWLVKDRDERGLNYIAQGDWCDPMNMVGYKGKGVSGWLTVATGYALSLWAKICAHHNAPGLQQEFTQAHAAMVEAANTHLWDGKWYARGITDDNITFGIEKDPEGKMFLNPQSWALLAQACDQENIPNLLDAIEEHLGTPYGPVMLAPAFTKMRDDVGRVTQKFPGSAENGSVYNHAAVFYIFSLYTIGESDRAFHWLRTMLTGPTEADYLQRGQMPIYIPNYYRGAYHQFPRTAGRSSQLFNTGTVSWVYRCIVEGLLGLQGHPEGLLIKPQFPKHWDQAQVSRHFRGAIFNVTYKRAEKAAVRINDQTLSKDSKGRFIAREITPGATYSVTVEFC